MIATDRFVYVHLHKAGGTFVNECLERYFPGARRLGYHLPASLIPAELQSLPVLGFVRSPWSYYVSWYTFQSQMAQEKSWTSAKIGEMEVLIMVITISWLMVRRRL